MPEIKKSTSVLLIALLCLTITATSSSFASGTYSLSHAAENSSAGGSTCSDMLNGFSIGMTIATFFGCLWCPAAGVAAKIISITAC
jgi:hypothetical protein